MKNVLCLLLLSALLGDVSTTMAQSSPNIVLILADDLGYGDVGVYGADHLRTPHLDRLAAAGVRFTQFYADAPQCTPTRTALLTGRCPQRPGGLETALGLGGYGRYEDAVRLDSTDDLGLPPEFSVLPSGLKEAGYATAIVGKWHLGYEPKFDPTAHGFDFAVGPIGGAVDYFHHTEPIGEFLGYELSGEHLLRRNGQPHVRDGYYMTDLITDEAIAWINIQDQDRPFFLYVPYTTPHAPYQGPDDYRPEPLTSEEWSDGATPEVYAEMVESMDEGIGRILDKLEAEGIAENTLVIFFSDNGPASVGSAGPLSSGKGRVFEGGIRVPCIVRWPGHLEPGTVSRQVGSSMDLTASILRIGGAQTSPDRPLDGIDLLALVEQNKEMVPRTLFWRARRFAYDRRAVRDGDLKYIYNRERDGTHEYLFDLSADVAEEHNLASTRPDDLDRLRSLLQHWMEEITPER